VLNTLDGWRFSESDRKNVILGGDDAVGVVAVKAVAAAAAVVVVGVVDAKK